MLSLEADESTAVRPLLGLTVAVAIASLAGLLLLGAGSTQFALAELGAVIAAAACLGVVYTARHRSWQIFALTLADLLMGGAIIPEAAQRIGHYMLDFLICLPAVPFVWRYRIPSKGGFKLYTVYFSLALLSILYSIDPIVSIGRLARSVLVFSVVTVSVFEIESADDVVRTFERFLLACGAGLMIVGASLVLLPHDLVWGIFRPEVGSDLIDKLNPDEANRFRGIFDTPNDVGELMLITVGPALVCWRRSRGWKRLLLAMAMASSAGFTILAKSRTAFVAVGVSLVIYLIWKYRSRAITIGIAFALVIAIFLGTSGNLSRFHLADYAERDIATLTGRTDAWKFAIEQIRERPLTGYGYAVEGEIFQNRYFPLWWGPWDLGSRISMHNGYLSRAVGVGISGLLFWLFIVLRPWFAVFRRRDDPWDLKPVALLVVLPIMVHNLAESSVGDFIYQAGVLFGLTWALAERQRLLAIEQERDTHAESLAHLPRVIAAIAGCLVIAVGVLAMPRTGAASEFYVDAVIGSDSNSGTSSRSPLKSLAAMRTLRPSPGDRILLARGRVWRESLRIDPPWVGTPRAPITLGSYGSGPAPVVTGADVITGFRPVANSRCYQAEVPSSVERVFVDGNGFIANHRLGDPASLTPGSWALSGNQLYLRLGDESSPLQHRIEVTLRRWGIRCWQCRYVVLEGLEIWGSWDDGINIDGPVSGDAPTANVTVRDCVIHDIGRGGYDESGVQAGSTYARTVTVESSRIFRIGLVGGGLGIVLNRCEGCTARNNEVYDVGHIAIAVQVTHDVPGLPEPAEALVASNRVHDCPGSLAGRDHADAIYVRAAKNVRIENNEIWNIASQSPGSGNAIHVGRRSGNVTAVDNRGRDCAGGIYIDEQQFGSVQIKRNTFSAVRLFFVRVCDLDLRNLLFVDNTYSQPLGPSPFVVGASAQRLTLAQWRALGQN